MSHISTEAFFPCPEQLDPKLKDEWAIAQVLTSVDYGHNSIWTFLSGALNYQSVHHLFPGKILVFHEFLSLNFCLASSVFVFSSLCITWVGVSQYHYPAIAPIIMKVCKKWGVPFNHVEGGFVRALWLHIKYLRDMGNQTLKGHPGLPATGVKVN